MDESDRLAWELSEWINKENLDKKSVVFACVGNSKVIGDSVGPMVGTMLKEMLAKNNYIYNVGVVGDCKYNLNYKNIPKYCDFLNSSNSFIVVVDSALASAKDIGKIYINNKGIKYGEALKKENEVIGNIGINAIVGQNLGEINENFKALTNTSSKTVEIISKVIANGIIKMVQSNFNRIV